ncbi:SLIT and NTRK-like protein 5 [Stegostoma tigrinum]|uniref:SLIT and NTRK-like protein 5 n=1 Tax=Stegostoma tigrinum TaxID=3053191 RepID=UPI00202B37F3|nr:SLIT and NTRK-like protein 5 [Stegostoma tigrinum]XP_048388805.1 SLIT and NTRK-like protein 5 [Stegostoma tigrinum]XP_048388806.1 SLIT and NTRK-like protein 5 [Stegostoma tigrinum]
MSVWLTRAVTLASLVGGGGWWWLGAVASDGSESYGEVCETLCSCQEKDGVLVLGCEDSRIVSVLQLSPPHWPLYHLFLSGNLLSRLQPDEFLNFSGAAVLHLGGNRIEEIEAGAFRGLHATRRLHLNNNRLEGLRRDAFAGLERLEYLQLDYNYLRRLESGNLDRLPHLQVLILNDNLLAGLPADLFRHVPLTHLDLRGNRLRALPHAGLLEHLGGLAELQLEDNPWDCGCPLLALKAWLESISYTALVGEVVCETPFRLHGRDLGEVSRQELCPRRPGGLDSDWKPPFAPPPLSTRGYFHSSPPPAATPNLPITSSPSRYQPKGTRLPKAPSSRVRVTTSRNPFLKMKGELDAEEEEGEGQGYPYGPIFAYQTKPPVPLVCPRQCSCNLQISELGLNVNCQERRIERVSELQPKPYNPRKLYLSGNRLAAVRRGDFEEAAGLELLHLGHNRITAVQDGAFSNLTQLRRLYLNGNCLEALGAGSFRGLRNLRYLYLEYNALRRLGAGTLAPAPGLQLLFLHHNLLRSLPPRLFAGLSLTRLSLRGNRFASLPVAGLLDQLASLIQIELDENPWECGCPLLGMKRWLERLGPGALVRRLSCQSPKHLAGQDLASLRSDLICPDHSDEVAFSTPSLLLPAPPGPAAARPLATAGPATPFPDTGSVVPLSVLILSLLLVFLASVFVAAGLFVVVMKRRKRAQSERTSANNSDVSSFNLQYSVYSHGPAPKAKSPVGHVYEYIPHPLGHMCKNPIYRSREGNSVDDYRDLHELKVTYRNPVDEERENQLRSPSYSISTIEPHEQVSPVQDVEHFYRGILEPGKQSPTGNSVEYKFGSPPNYNYSPNYEVRRQYLHPERMRETVLYGAPSNVYAEQIRNDYLELKAKLHIEPDYLEVLEKQTTCSQF